MAAAPKDLIVLEKNFWTGDEAFYRANVDQSCLVAFTEMAGVMGNAEVAATVGAGSRWSDLEITEKGFLQPSGDVAIVSYEARAQRPDGRSYRALVSSGYVRRGSSWKMMFHAQTPLQTE
jgi:hypothetical protein